MHLTPLPRTIWLKLLAAGAIMVAAWVADGVQMASHRDREKQHVAEIVDGYLARLENTLADDLPRADGLSAFVGTRTSRHVLA